MIKGNPQAREGKFVCSEGHAVVHQIWQKPPILPGLTYLTPVYVSQELHNNLSLKNERSQLNTTSFFLWTL